MSKKVCGKCKKEKSFSSFSKNRTTKDGYQDRCIACRKEYHKSKKGQDAHRERNLQQNYGITLQEYDNLLEDQEFKCAVCKTEDPGGRGRFHVDHCHSTGKIRGLLCHHCNLMLGQAKDNISTLLAAIQYLNNDRH